MFGINSLTGVITTREELDFESQSLHTLHVMASNPGLQETLATVFVHVNSVNEYRPVFTQRQYNFDVNAAVETGDAVGSVLATG